jgi:16S rRNA (uracil1498-N3)-methyltransferase
MREQTVAPPRPAVHLHVAPPKGERAERLLDAASQLGAASVTCLRTARSVVEPRPGKQERWRRLAIESAKQCRRAHLLELRPPVDFRKALERAATAGPVVVLHAAGDPYQVNDTRVEGEVALFVGPEGGWTDEELTIARDHDAAIVRLTGYTLRIETAALAGLAVITQYHDDLNQRED